MNILLRLSAALVCVVCLQACQPAEQTPAATADKPLRIVSLAPHLTELAFSAGAGENLVGVVEYSDYPDAAREIARVGDAFNVDLERLVILAPDVVLTWQSGTPTALQARLGQMGFKVVPVETLTLADIPVRLTEIGALAGDIDRARNEAEKFTETLDQLRRQSNDKEVVRVFYQISLDPLYTIGGQHFITEVITLCGGRNVFSGLPETAAAVGREAVLNFDPQLILTDQQTLDETRAAWAPFSLLSAVRLHSVFGIDADLVARPTMRLAQGAVAVCSAIERARSAVSARP